MPRIDVPFVVEKQHITQPTGEKLVSGGQNYFYATFEITDVWTKVSNIKAVFVRDAISKLVDLIKTDTGYECQIPWEVMGYKGAFQVGIFGGDRLLTDYTYVIVKQGCVVEGEVPSPPSPDWFSEMEKKIQDISDSKIDNEVIAEAVEKYMAENPVDVPDETDPTVPDWAKQPNKPTYTPDEIGTLSATAITEKITQTVDEETQIIKADIEGIQEDIKNESHFRGYVSTNAKIQEMEATPNDFAYSAESGTVWVYDAEQGWQETDTPVPDKGTPLSNATPLINGVASAGTSEEGARSDHRHPTDTTRLGVVEFNEFVAEFNEFKEDVPPFVVNCSVANDDSVSVDKRCDEIITAYNNGKTLLVNANIHGMHRQGAVCDIGDDIVYINIPQDKGSYVIYYDEVDNKWLFEDFRFATEDMLENKADKTYVDNQIGDIETVLDNIITKYGLGGDVV